MSCEDWLQPLVPSRWENGLGHYHIPASSLSHEAKKKPDDKPIACGRVAEDLIDAVEPVHVGHGAYGFVSAIDHVMPSNTYRLALKTLDLSSPYLRTSARNEILALRDCGGHPHIVWLESPHSPPVWSREDTQVVLVMEQLPTTLWECMHDTTRMFKPLRTRKRNRSATTTTITKRKHKRQKTASATMCLSDSTLLTPTMPTTTTRTITVVTCLPWMEWGFQLLRGITYVHQRGWVHGDLKPSNILYQPSDGRVVVCDFGMARKCVLRGMIPHLHGVTTLWYRAPELAVGAPFYSAAVDIWSIGCCIVEWILREPLFREARDDKSLFRLMKHYLGAPSYDWMCQFVGKPHPSSQQQQQPPPFSPPSTTAHLWPRVYDVLVHVHGMSTTDCNDIILCLQHMLRWYPEERSSAHDLLQNVVWNSVRGSTEQKWPWHRPAKRHASTTCSKKTHRQKVTIGQMIEHLANASTTH